MKKKDLTKLALVGLSSGLFFGCQSGGTDGQSESMGSSSHRATMSEDEFLSKLDTAHRTLYQNMDADAQAMTLRVASTQCHGQNVCKGLNGCKTKDHACAGLGECKGQGGCAVTDPNLAVKLVQKHMAEKRLKMNY